MRDKVGCYEGNGAMNAIEQRFLSASFDLQASLINDGKLTVEDVLRELYGRLQVERASIPLITMTYGTSS